MINVEINWRTRVGILVICFLVKDIYAWKFRTTLKYKFPVWERMIWLWIRTHCCLCHIIWFSVNKMPIWHQCVFICFIYVICFSPRSSILSILDLILEFFQIMITPCKKWGMYNFCGYATLTTTHDLVSWWYIFLIGMAIVNVMLNHW